MEKFAFRRFLKIFEETHKHRELYLLFLYLNLNLKFLIEKPIYF